MRVNSNVNRGICIQPCVSVGSLIVTNVAGEGVCVCVCTVGIYVCVYSGHMRTLYFLLSFVRNLKLV